MEYAALAEMILIIIGGAFAFISGLILVAKLEAETLVFIMLVIGAVIWLNT